MRAGTWRLRPSQGGRVMGPVGNPVHNLGGDSRAALTAERRRFDAAVAGGLDVEVARDRVNVSLTFDCVVPVRSRDLDTAVIPLFGGRIALAGDVVVEPRTRSHFDRGAMLMYFGANPMRLGHVAIFGSHAPAVQSSQVWFDESGREGEVRFAASCLTAHDFQTRRVTIPAPRDYVVNERCRLALACDLGGASQSLVVELAFVGRMR